MYSAIAGPKPKSYIFGSTFEALILVDRRQNRTLFDTFSHFFQIISRFFQIISEVLCTDDGRLILIIILDTALL